MFCLTTQNKYRTTPPISICNKKWLSWTENQTYNWDWAHWKNFNDEAKYSGPKRWKWNWEWAYQDRPEGYRLFGPVGRKKLVCPSGTHFTALISQCLVTRSVSLYTTVTHFIARAIPELLSSSGESVRAHTMPHRNHFPSRLSTFEVLQPTLMPPHWVTSPRYRARRPILLCCSIWR